MTRIPLNHAGSEHLDTVDCEGQNEPPAAYLAIRGLRALDGLEGTAQ